MSTNCEHCQVQADSKLCQTCAAKQAKRDKRNKARRDQHQAMLDLGLKRVKGALGGVYYE